MYGETGGPKDWTADRRRFLRALRTARHSRVLVVACTMLCWSCAATAATGGSTRVAEVRERLDVLLQEHEAEVRRLDEVQRQIRVAQEVLAAHRSRVSFVECQAKRAELDAAVSAARADCLASLARHEACLAQHAEDTMDNEVLGGLLGLGVAVLTGGAAAPFVLGGVATGRVMSGSGEGECGSTPACTILTDHDRLAAALWERGLDSMPSCEKEQDSKCEAEHFLFLLGDLESVDSVCLGDRAAECIADQRLVALGVRSTSDCDEPPTESLGVPGRGNLGECEAERFLLFLLGDLESALVCLGDGAANGSW